MRFRFFLIFVVSSFLLSACSSKPSLFSGDLSSLPEGKEIRMEGILEKNLSKTGSYEWYLDTSWITYDGLHDIWLTFHDDFNLESMLNRKIIVTGNVHHFNDCEPELNPDIPKQCAIAEQLRVKTLK